LTPPLPLIHDDKVKKWQGSVLSRFFEAFEVQRRCEMRGGQCPARAGCPALARWRVLRGLAKAWEGFKESYAGLTQCELMGPRVTGDWSVRDLIAHVTWWEEEAIKYLPLILQGLKPPRYSEIYGGIDAFNAMMTDKKRGLSLGEVLREQEVTHRRLVEFLQGVPEDRFCRETPFRRRLRLDTYGHYRIHGEQIRQWRQSRLHGRQFLSPGDVGETTGGPLGA